MKMMLKATLILAQLSAGIWFSLFIVFEANVLDHFLRYANRIRNGTFTIPISKDASGPNKFFVPRNAGIWSFKSQISLVLKRWCRKQHPSWRVQGIRSSCMEITKLVTKLSDLFFARSSWNRGFPCYSFYNCELFNSLTRRILISSEIWTRKGYLYFRMQCNVEYQHQRRCFSEDTHNAHWSPLLESWSISRVSGSKRTLCSIPWL